MRTAYCFDLDGTLTKEEILPLLSREVQLYDEISALTEATIKGVIPFKKSFLLRCRLLSDLPLSRAREIIGQVEVYKEIVSFISEHRQDCFVVTGNLDVWLESLAVVIPCPFYSSKAYSEGDSLGRVTEVLDKGTAIRDIRQRYDRIVAVGDGMGDVAMFEQADLCIAFGGTHAPVRSLIQYANYLVYSERSLCTLLRAL
jgi:phosphoserine phosphatase